jgi:hypothetical protein
MAVQHATTFGQRVRAKGGVMKTKHYLVAVIAACAAT